MRERHGSWLTSRFFCRVPDSDQCPAGRKRINVDVGVAAERVDVLAKRFLSPVSIQP
jgi:hypothetical protein